MSALSFQTLLFQPLECVIASVRTVTWLEETPVPVQGLPPFTVIVAGAMVVEPVGAFLLTRVHTVAVRGFVMLAGTMKGFHVTVWPVATALTWSEVEGKGARAMRVEIHVTIRCQNSQNKDAPASSPLGPSGGREGPSGRT